MKQEMITYLNTIKDEIYAIAKYLYENPEEGYREYKSASYLCNILKQNGFKITEKFMDISTAFCAELGNGHPRICFLCEYDAIPPHGHINGHNLVSAISIAAALSLSKIIDRLNATIVVLGCPGEYIGGAKVTMAKQGIFNDIDIAMMVHPDVVTAESGTSNAIIPLSIKFSASTGFTYMKNDYCSPLDASLFIFNGINLLLKDCANNIKVDAMLNSGGYIPSLPNNTTEMKLYIRTPTTESCEKTEKNIKNLVNTVSSITGIASEITLYELPYQELITNKTLSRIFCHNLKEVGIIDCCNTKDTEAGISIGTASHYVPCIHPYISIIDDNSIIYGTEEFAKATISPLALERVLNAASALAITAFDITQKVNLLSDIKEEFFNTKK